MKFRHLIFSTIFLTLLGCIGDDVIFDTVAEAVTITIAPDTLAVDDSFQLTARFTNNIGQVEEHPIDWASTDASILTVDAAGLVTGITKGNAAVVASASLTDGRTVADTAQIVVDEETVVTNTSRSGVLKTTSGYNLKGNFELTATATGVLLSFSTDYEASTSLPGLYVYLGNNPSSIANALEIGLVAVYDGAHSYEIPAVGLNDYGYVLYWCKPFGVKVGEGKIE